MKTLIQRLQQLFEPIWQGINYATGAAWLNQHLTRRRARKDLELAQALRAAGMNDQADRLAESTTRRLLVR